MAVAVRNLIIEVEQVKEKGKIWNVRLYKKILFVKRVVSSDWFLDEQQAQTFAKQLADQLNGNSTLEAIKSRQPGWTLVRTKN